MSNSDQTDPYQPDTSITPLPDAVETEQPQHIGRYRVERLLGKGAFGLVFLAHDEQLSRPVAIKVPHRNRVARPEEVEAYLGEARTVANLDHPHIVPVFDVGSTAEHPCFFVTKYIEGCTLAQMLLEGRPPCTETAEIVATIAEALHHAHRKGLVHRDIKPGNILLENRAGDGQRPTPYLADFGLALREESVGKGPRYAGTPAYMSPEQARGEGHRVDGRSDLFSLSVVFYEMLTGRRPFHADSRDELLEQIATQEPRPLRQWDDTIPKELERICLKALSKRASERYSAAKDMADDLRHFLALQIFNPHLDPGLNSASTLSGVQPSSPSATSGASGTSSTATATPASEYRLVKIVPKGLRSFDAHDADFFLELLPGPRDREGLPDSIRFWKTRIEETDADNTFAVGLIYGPSGCGKSSLVKAGLLPLLANTVLTVYLEATAGETETRLLNGLRKRCPALLAKWGLKESLAALRCGEGLPTGKKVLIVLDQFEQWLHAPPHPALSPGGRGLGEGENSELVQALRQCDGGRVQCVVMVRDDFWMATTRFMRELEIRLLEGQNSAAVDLFDLDHARKVLAAFGRAFGKLPQKHGETNKEQKEFLKQAVAGLVQEGKVICVRLAVFAEMMKGKPWTPLTLKEVGGAAGVGVTFLEDTFSSATAPPERRYHQQAARAVLKALLPESGTNIKGHMRSYTDLLEASGYGNRPKDFDDVVRILDGEIRLITPTDTEGVEGGGWRVEGEAGGGWRVEGEGRGASTPSGSVPPSTLHPPPSTTPSTRFYQLTHDYLVHSLRDWLTRKQKETRRGRAELLLADRASIWNARQENLQLPSLPQWLYLRWFTSKKNWKPTERKMMGKASRYHAVRGLVVALLLALVGWGCYEGYGTIKAHALRERLLDANSTEVPAIVTDMAPYRHWLDPLLQEANREAAASQNERKQLNTSLALLPVDPGQKQYLYERLLKADTQEIAVIREALLPYKQDLSEPLWALLEDRKIDRDRRLRAACGLVRFDPDNSRWRQVSAEVVATLVTQNPLVIGKWVEALRPVRSYLLPSLGASLGDEDRSAAERRLIAKVYGDYADGNPGAFAHLESLMGGHSDPTASPEEKVAAAKWQANFGVALLFLGQGDDVWPLLKQKPDPTVRSFLIERLGPMGVDTKTLALRFEEEQDVSIRRAILLSLDGFGPDRLPLAERQNWFPRLEQMYEDDPDPGIHGAAGWLLRKWGQESRLREIDKELATGKVEGKRRWYVNRQGQTMVLVPGPIDFVVGEGAAQTKRRLDSGFAIGNQDVAVAQFHQFRKDHPHAKDFVETDQCPVGSANWYDAAAYCNWLSKEEGLAADQWCYEPNEAGQYAEGMKLAPDWRKRTGYRLPTEAEWECACRAGSITTWSWGEAEELTGQYAWYVLNSLHKTHPTGVHKPNDLGLFDMHGNVWQWCQDRYEAGKGQPANEEDGAQIVAKEPSRSVRGGSFVVQAVNLRSAGRGDSEPTGRSNVIGFRLARTLR